MVRDVMFFFFQAEDGIRDSSVTGVQTCALPIFPFDEILDAVKDGNVEAGLVIHEGQLTYEAEGLQKVVDLGEWWLLETGLPRPLGANVARRDLGPEVLHDLSGVLADSIAAGLENRRAPIRYAPPFAPGHPSAP